METSIEDSNGEPPSLHCLVYASAGVRPFSEEELRDLLVVARTNNKRVSITGMLVYHRGSFFQLLEGPRKAVELIFDRIQKDPRHAEITVLMDSPIKKRHFPQWTMGFPSLSPELLTELEGYSDLASPDSNDLELLRSHVSRLFDLIAAAA